MCPLRPPPTGRPGSHRYSGSHARAGQYFGRSHASPQRIPSAIMSPILLAVFLVALVACLLRHARSRPPHFPPGEPTAVRRPRPTSFEIQVTSDRVL